MSNSQCAPNYVHCTTHKIMHLRTRCVAFSAVLCIHRCWCWFWSLFVHASLSPLKTWNCIIIEFIVIILRWDKNCSIHFTLHWAEYWRCNATYQLHTKCRQSHRLLANQCFRLLFHSHTDTEYTDSCAFSTSSFFSVRFVCTRPNSIYYFHSHNFLLDPIVFTVDLSATNMSRYRKYSGEKNHKHTHIHTEWNCPQIFYIFIADSMCLCDSWIQIQIGTNSNL